MLFCYTKELHIGNKIIMKISLFDINYIGTIMLKVSESYYASISPNTVSCACRCLVIHKQLNNHLVVL